MYLEKENVGELKARIMQIEKYLEKNLTSNQRKWLINEKRLWEEIIVTENSQKSKIS